jgi:hypothetical protein
VNTRKSDTTAGARRPPTLKRTLSRQYGVIGLDQATSLGLLMSTIRCRIRPGGPWQRILPGVYLTESGPPTHDQLDMAALLYAGPQALITGIAALRRCGLQHACGPAVDVLVPQRCGRASRDHVRLHRTVRMPSLVVVQGPIELAMAPRATIDAARHLFDTRDLRAVVAGVVQQRLCTLPELRTELSLARMPNAEALRAVLGEVAAGIRSAPEGDLMDLINQAGLPRPLYNADLYLDDVFLARPDAWWREVSVAAEVDSRAHHSSAYDFQRTMRRHTKMTAAGIRLLHFSPAEIRSHPLVVIARITDALRTGAPIARIRTVPRKPEG